MKKLIKFRGAKGRKDYQGFAKCHQWEIIAFVTGNSSKPSCAAAILSGGTFPPMRIFLGEKKRQIDPAQPKENNI